MIKYRFIQEQKSGTTWLSDFFEAATLRHVTQAVIAGHLMGEPRRAVDEHGALLFGLDAKGREVSP